MHGDTGGRWQRARMVTAWLLIASLAALPAGCGGSGTSAPAPEPAPAPAPLGAAGFGPSKWVINSIANGIVSYITGQSAGWLLSFVGGDDDSLKDDVDHMNQELDEVIAQLAQIEEELGEIMEFIKISSDEIKNIEQQFLIAEPQNVVNNTYDNMSGVFTADKIGTPTGKAASLDTTSDILSTARTNIDQQMYDIHAGIMGATPGVGDGAMNAFTTTLVDHTGDGKLLKRYEALETYFERLVTVQTKGLTMMAEALHARDSQPGGGVVLPGDYAGTAQQWMDDKFTPWMEDEVEEFLRCTERLVLAECDLRTEVATGGPFLPADAAEILERADFIAAQIAPARHGYGAIVRVIGEPKTVKSIVADYDVEANGSFMAVVKLGLDKQDVREVPVEKWNHWPSGWAEYYMEWAWASAHGVSDFIEFSRTNQIAVAKFALPLAANATTYDVTTTFPHETASASLTTCECDSDMKCDSDSQQASPDDKEIYGHGVVAIRHRPHVWYHYSHGEDVDDRLTPLADASLSGHPSWARSRVTVNENIHWYNSWADFQVESGIALPLVNGDDGSRKMTSVVEMESHLYGSLDLSVDSHTWLHLWWTSDSSGHHTWEATGGDGHRYGKVSPHRYFDAHATESLFIKSWMEGSGKGLEGEDHGLRVWPRYLYLYY